VELVTKAEDLLKRRVRTLVVDRDEYQKLVTRLQAEGYLVIWKEGERL
jgi:glycerol-3-phosphate dehydrogenase